MKTVKHLFIFLFLSVLIITSCKTGFYSEKYNSKSKENGIIYALPKAKIIVNLEITKQVKQKGIFSEFTHLYFNTKNTISEDELKYYISDFSVKTIPVIDSSKIYKIVSKRNINPLLLNLSKENFISGINLNDVQAGKVNEKQTLNRSNEIKNKISDYADISLSSVREVKYDTIYKEVMRDSVMIKIPVIKKKEVYKSKAKQAKETAEFIFNLRDDRYALLTGENDGNNFPDGEALKQMINQLSELEKKYMSLFTGREINLKKLYQFEFIPEINQPEISKVMFYFSEKKGITNDTLDVPVILSFKPAKLNIKGISQSDKKLKGIIYRIPGKAAVSISLKGKDLYRSEFEIPQIGTLNLIPANLFKSKVTVEFYPESGSLKRISLVK